MWHLGLVSMVKLAILQADLSCSAAGGRGFVFWLATGLRIRDRGCSVRNHVLNQRFRGACVTYDPVTLGVRTCGY